MAACYARRTTLVCAALAQAQQAGLVRRNLLRPGLAHPMVMYLELPDVGQVPWHLPAHPTPWDGPTITAKYERIAAFLRQRR